MEEFPANNSSKKKEPVVGKVVENEVTRRKQPLGRRFASTFIKGEATSVWEYVLWDILIPSAKDTIADSISQGAERMLFGEARSSSRRTGRAPTRNGGSRVIYEGMSSKRAERPERSRPSRTHDFDEIVLATRPEADAVLDAMFDLIKQYETVTVTQFYDLVDVTGTYMDNKWGWNSLEGVDVQRVREGYIITLPRPVQLD